VKADGSSAWTVLATVLAPISWGTTYITTTEMLPQGQPLLVAAVRVVPAGIVLVVVTLIRSRWRPHGSEWARTAALALFNFVLFFPLLIAGVYRLPGGVAAAAGGLQPLFVAVLTWVINDRRPRSFDLAVGCVAAIGVGFVVIRPGAHLSLSGLLFAAAANLSFSVGVVLTKRFSVSTNRIATTGWQLLLSGVVLVPLVLVVEGAPPSLTARNIVGFAYLGLVGTAIAYTLWFNGIRRLAATSPPLLGLSAPVTGAVLGWVVLGQSLSPIQLAGFVLTISAIAYGALVGARTFTDVQQG
jgi:probable blue pigment (indigoidine) exporter